jgi:hypothetical protein
MIYFTNGTAELGSAVCRGKTASFLYLGCLGCLGRKMHWIGADSTGSIYRVHLALSVLEIDSAATA